VEDCPKNEIGEERNKIMRGGGDPEKRKTSVMDVLSGELQVSPGRGKSYLEV
jgi:hypothetical protein